MKKSILLSLAFALILVVVFREFLFDSSLLMLNSDQLNGIGSRILRVQNFILTEWDDSRLAGMPTLDATFSDAYHPLALVQWLVDPARAVGFKFILTVWVAFLCAYALFRKITGRYEWAALLAFLYALNPQYFTHIYGGHDGKMMVFAIAPLVVLSLHLILREGKAWAILMLTPSVLWMILSSHLQLTYLFLWGAGLYTMYEVFNTPLSAMQRTFRIGIAALGLALALGLGSFQVIPPYLYSTQDSVRGSDEKTTLGHAVSWSLHQEELASMLVPGFLGTDVEQERGYWGHNSFKLNHDSAGALLTFLGFLGLFVANNRRNAIFWFVGSAVALSYAMGGNSPLFSLWYQILPGVKNFRAPSMAIFWIPLAMGMMAAPVLDALRNKEAREKLIPGVILFSVLVAIVVVARFAWESLLGIPGGVIATVMGLAIVGTLNIQDRGEKFSLPNIIAAWTSGLKQSNKLELAFVMIPFLFVAAFFISSHSIANNPDMAPYFQSLNLELMSQSAALVIPSALLVLATALVAFFATSSSRPLWQTAGILVLVASLDLFFVDHPFVQNVPRSTYLQPGNPVIEAILTDSPDPLQRPRVLSVSRNPALSGNIFPAYGMRNAIGTHDNELASYRTFRGGQNSENLLVDPQNNPFLNLLNVGYIIYDTPEGTRPMRNAAAMPIATLYGAYEITGDDSVITLLKNGFDYRNTILLDHKPEGIPDEANASTSPSPTTMGIDSTLSDSSKANILAAITSATTPRKISGTVRLVSSPKMDTQVFDVTASGPGIVLVSGGYHRYWKAEVDGKSTPVLRAFSALRAVAVPAGSHQLTMRYRSDTVALSLKITIVSGILFLLLGLGIGFRAIRAKNK